MKDGAFKAAVLPVLALAIQWAVLSCAPAAAAEKWQGANLTSLTAFVRSLEAERYTALVFKRMSSDLAKGDVSTLSPLLERYYQERRGQSAEEAFDADALAQGVASDVADALRELEKSSALSVPAYMAGPVGELARRTALRAYGLGQAVPRTEIPVNVPEEVRNESLPEPKARAENTGLFRDAAEMFLQPHLRYLFGGDDQTAGARVLAEVLRIARSDNLIVDRQSVEALANRLVETEKIHPDDWPILVDQTLVELGLAQPSPPAIETPPEADPPPGPPATEPEPVPEPEPAPEARPAPEPEPQPEPQSEPEPDAAPDGDLPPPDENTVDAPPGDAADAVTAPEAVVPAKPVVHPPDRRTRVRRVVQRTPQRTAPGKSDLLVVVEVGAGLAGPTAKGKLAGVGQGIAFDPGPSTQFGIGLLWPQAIGNAHLGLSLVGLLGKNEADRLTGPGAASLNGSHVYYGLMPYLTIDLPVAERVNLRFGGGIGLAERDLEAFSGGVKVVDASATSLIARAGAGIRFGLAPCVDGGFDVLATYLDGMSGVGAGGVGLRLRSTWDVAVHASIRVMIARGEAPNGCGLFGP